MKWVMIMWGGPVLFLTGWYVLSYYDMSFGIFMLTREAHDMVFALYGNILGMPPEVIPPLVARAMVVDTFIVFGLLALRRRKQLAAWYVQRFRKSQPAAPKPASLASNVNLSNAP